MPQCVCVSTHFMSVFFFKQKTAYEIPKRDWSSDVCSSDLTFQVLLKQIVETKAQLQQLVDLQPKLKSDEDKKKAEEAVKATQERVNKLSEEFKKSRGFDYPSENGTIPAEAKLFVQITEAEKAKLEKATAKPEEKKADAPATEEKAK